MIEFSLRNETEEFLRYDEVVLELADDIKDDVKIVVGQDLVNWSEGIKNKVAIDQYNTRLILTGISALGAAAAVASTDQNVQNMGLGAFVLGAGAISLNDFQDYRDRLRGTKFADLRGLVPETHILAGPISVPPGLFLNRFAVFQMKKDVREKFHTLKVNLTNQKSEKISFEGTFNHRLKKQQMDELSMTEKLAADGKWCFGEGDELRVKGRKILCYGDCKTHFSGWDLKDCRKRVEERMSIQ